MKTERRLEMIMMIMTTANLSYIVIIVLTLFDIHYMCNTFSHYYSPIIIIPFYRRRNIITRNNCQNDKILLEDLGFKPGILVLKSKFLTNGCENPYGIESTGRTRTWNHG